MHEGGESKTHSNTVALKKSKGFSRRVKATCLTQSATGFLAAVSFLRLQSRYKVVTSVMDFSLYGLQTMTGLNYLVLHFEHRDNGRKR